VGFTVPWPGATDTLDALWIPSLVPEATARWAERYIAFALSKVVQEQWCRALGVLPIHRDASPPPIFAETSGLPRSADEATALVVADAIKLTREPAWERRFDAIVARAAPRAPPRPLRSSP
jgi:putative spermidine/putrescine transport system substrate-binding protein